MDHDAQHPGGQDAHRGRGGSPVVELDALAELAQGAGGRRAALHLGHVLLVHPVRGVGEQLGQVAVVGQDQEAFGLLVEPAHRKDGGLGRHQVQHGRAPVRVGRRRDDPGGLVQQVVDEVGRHGQQDPVHLDPGRGHVDPAAQDGDLPVHRDPAGGDQLLAHPTGSLPGPGQHLLQALAAGRRRVGHHRDSAVVGSDLSHHPEGGLQVRPRTRRPPRARAGSPPPAAAGPASPAQTLQEQIGGAVERGLPGPSARPTTSM